MKRTHIIFFFILLLGVVLTFSGFLGWYSTFVLNLAFIIFCVLVAMLIVPGYVYLSTKKNLSFLLTTLSFIWALHVLQVLVPETGFDALWYHLPVADAVVDSQQFLFIPDLYQSVNPLFADTYFFAGYSAFSELGTKIVAYLFGLLLISATFLFSRNFFSEKNSLKIIILVSLFQVVSWQSSSFYVDVAKAFFEVLMLIFTFELITETKESFSTKRTYIFSLGLSMGAILATKLFSILLLPFFSLILWKLYRKSNGTGFITLLIPGVLIPFLFYSFAYQATGNPFYSIFHHIQKLDQIGSSNSLRIYIFDRLTNLPGSFISLLRARDYIYPLVAFVPVALIFFYRSVFQSEKLKLLTYFAGTQWIIWWFVPPLSTRYALSGFIVLLLIGIQLIKNVSLVLELFRSKIGSVFFWFSVAALLVPRVIVAERSLKYLIYMQSTEEYLEQFYDGSIDEKINDWYVE